MDEQRCVACHGRDVRTVETISAARIAEGWRREDLANDRADIADARAAAVKRLLPRTLRFDRCGACGLEMARPAVVWRGETYPDHSYPVRWEFAECADDLGAAPLDVLELGCGTGEFLALASARGHRAVGVDFGAAPVALARGRGLTAFHASIDDLTTHLPAGARFDAIAFFQVIEHVPDPDALFEALGGWTRPSARLFVACPGARRYTRLIREQRVGLSDFWDYPPQHVFRWTLPAIQAVARRHGWTTVRSAEEPLDRVAAASHIGVARALHRGIVSSAMRRRLTIAGARLTVALAPRSRRAGTSMYAVLGRAGAAAG